VLIGNKADVKQSSSVLRISDPLPGFKGMSVILSALQLDESKLAPFFEAAIRQKQRSAHIDAGEIQILTVSLLRYAAARVATRITTLVQ
jgi:hypothetical protein